jgi:anti-sigma regulatory factor (Ser/Thr protein kinase)
VTTADLHVTAERGALPRARSWVCDQARLHGLSAPLTQVVELLTSELVANAVTHGSGPRVLLRAGVEGDFFVVSVDDGSDAMPVMRSTGPEVPGGQGMRLVDRLAESWGVDPASGGGKTVWFRVARAAGA